MVCRLVRWTDEMDCEMLIGANKCNTAAMDEKKKVEEIAKVHIEIVLIEIKKRIVD